MRSVMPRTSSAAMAMTMAPPSGILSRRRAMLPRSSTKRRSGRTPASWARRRTEPVATTAPSSRSPRDRPISGVGGVAPDAERGEAQAGRRLAREVLGRVHGGVGAAVEHCLLHLLDEDALAADRVQRNRLLAVPARLDEHQLRRPPGGRRDGVGDDLRLSPRLRAAPSGEPERSFRGHQRSGRRARHRLQARTAR